MANLNLSEFTEKLFVADADHTFIWDSAMSISKRVSRNSWLNSGTLTSDAPVTISQTWNAVGQTFKALVVNAAGSSDANSASGSLLLDLQLGGVSKFKVGKDGYPVAADGSYNVPAYRFSGGGSTNGISLYANSIYVNAGGSPQLSVHSSFVRIGPTLYFSVGDASNSHDIALTRDGAGQLALRNGAAAQTFNVYGTYTSITDYKRLSLSCSASTGNATIGVPFNSVLAVTGGSAPSTTATITFATQAAAFPVGSSVVVAGVTPSGYNGTYVVTASTTSSVSYTVGGALAAWSSGGTATVSGSAALTLTGAGNLGIGTTAPAVKLDVAGAVTAAGYYTATSGGVSLVANGLWQQGTGHLTLASGAILGWSGAVNVNTDQPGDTRLQRDAEADHLAMRRGALGQKFSVYGTYPGANWERFTITAPTSGNVLLGTYKGTGGIARGLEFQTDGVTQLTLAVAGTATFAGSVTGTNLIATNYIGVPAGNGLVPNAGGGSDFIKIGSNNGSELVRFGYFGTAATSYISFGGVAVTSPALKRSSTTIQARLANDSDFAPIQGKLTTETAFTATTVTPTGFITLYDSTGAAHKVPCVPA